MTSQVFRLFYRSSLLTFVVFVFIRLLILILMFSDRLSRLLIAHLVPVLAYCIV